MGFVSRTLVLVLVGCLSPLSQAGGYYTKCSGPEGFPGTCKPLAACAQYYATPANYDYDHANYYKSCQYGYGIKGSCCPDVYFGGQCRKWHISCADVKCILLIFFSRLQTVHHQLLPQKVWWRIL